MTQIKLRRDTAANFTSKNPVLGQGEPAYETDTKKMKIGDGTTAYNDLAYFDAGGGATPENMVTTDTQQLITGKKEFYSSINIYDSNLVRGVQSENYKNGAGLSMEDNNSSALRPFSPLWVGYDTSGNITSSSHIYTQDTIQLLKNQKNEPVVLDDDGKLPALDGSKLTNISTSPSTMFPFAQSLDKTRLNLNNATTNGLWYYDSWSNSNPTNTPLDNNDAFFLEVLRFQDSSNLSNNRTLQRLTYVYSSNINKTYIRSGIFTGYSQWTPWVELGGSGGSTSKTKVPDTTAAIDIASSIEHWTAPVDGVVFTGAASTTGRGFSVHEGHSSDETFSYIKSIVTIAGDVYTYGWFPVVKGQQVTFLFVDIGHVIKKFCPYKEIEVS